MTVLFVRSRAGRFVAWLMLGLVGAAGAVLYAWALLKIPDRMHLHDPQDRYNARILVISVGGAVVVGLGLLYTARTYSLSHRGQITDRFTKALEQLDADQLYVRVGGIQALGRLMHDSPIHHDDIIEVLTAFVRDRAPMTPSAPPVAESPPADVQAALTVLAHRPRRPERRASATARSRGLGDAAVAAPVVARVAAQPATVMAAPAASSSVVPGANRICSRIPLGRPEAAPRFRPPVAGRLRIWAGSHAADCPVDSVIP